VCPYCARVEAQWDAGPTPRPAGVRWISSLRAASNDWYLKDYPTALLKQDSEYDHDLGQDALLVEFPNDQDSTAIYDSTRGVTASRNPVQGETICASLGVTDQDGLGPGWDCGTVRVASLSWVASNGLIMRGADSDGIGGHPGDSGSPMVNSPKIGNLTALGIWDLADGGFARAQAVMDAFGVTINLSS
jgi:hypothetical protein